MVKNGLPPVHPGEFLRETLGELAVSQAQFARAISVAPMRVSHVIKGVRPVTAELALLFRAGAGPIAALLAQSSGRLRLETGRAGYG